MLLSLLISLKYKLFFFHVKIDVADEINGIRKTIRDLEINLKAKNSFRIHKSYIVDMNIAESDISEFLEIGKNTISISSSYEENVLKKLTEIS